MKVRDVQISAKVELFSDDSGVRCHYLQISANINDNMRSMEFEISDVDTIKIIHAFEIIPIVESQEDFNEIESGVNTL